ncbi:Mannitol 2-dehydrogenase [Phytophthora cinnamomi]|uniref:Mannitol 2-dehydrogenase n=1 Tax=Phytophthora cinnamomi TaxID=4785 RepID=UPI00355A4CD4|nr:Mannitol 2-dehydrogenase [Phytophthora cinnamomi]
MFQPLRSQASFPDNADAICIGSGRFLRCVLVPTLRAAGSAVVVAQTRGTSFAAACARAEGTYEVDTIQPDGGVQTESVQVDAVGSLGDAEGRKAFMQLPAKLPKLKFIGFGVTESGIVSGGPAIVDLTELLFHSFQARPDAVISVVNTDNLPRNGDAIKELVLETQWGGQPADLAPFHAYVESKVHFHNTMVDRLTSHRAGDALVPLTEPWPSKTLVIEDLHGVLDAKVLGALPGVHIRTTAGQLEQDHLLKLSIANAVHTAMVYLLALTRAKTTCEVLKFPEIRQFLDLLFAKDIAPSLVARGVSNEEAQRSYDEWMARVEHKHFGLDNFWVGQNAMLKYGVRLFSSVEANVTHDATYRPSVFMAFATAVILRYLTPTQADSRKESGSGSDIFVGALDSIKDRTPIYSTKEKTWVYANGLTANLSTGKYEFLDGEQGKTTKLLWQTCQNVFGASKSSSYDFPKSARAESSSEVSSGVGVAVASVLSSVKGFDLTNDAYASFAADVAALYQRLVSGKQTALETLEDVLRNHQTSEYLGTKEEVATFVRETVGSVQIIDVHTHLFPPSHGKLMLWGVNELLTYHYLVAEFLQTAPMQVEEFNTYPKEQQAGLIWQHLFVDRSPVSEACRGVLTTLHLLGLDHLVAKRDLRAIQEWFKQQDPEEYVDTVFRLSGLKYAVMTNIPFEPEEARHWLGDPATNTPPPAWSRKYFRSALRVDQILLGDWASIAPTLDVFKLPHTLAGVRTLLEKWIDIMKPEYFMSSVPISFEYPDENAPASSAGELPNGAELLLQVLLPLAEEKKLPIALKFDSVRPINARLGVAGDGVKPSDVDILIKLCRNFPKVKFLATFLSRVNQHEVTVTANKFRNLHLYGCWWYCNNPSIIEELTRMRIEILGTAFTSQHSDARVLDQLIYKWSHSRDIIGEVLVDMYEKLFVTGWKVSKSDIQRDVQRLFGLSYEEYMAKEM